MKPSPLAALILSDPAQIDAAAETKRQLINAYDRIEDLQNAVKGLLGLIQLVAGRDDILPEVRDALTTSHRIFYAQEILR